MGEESRRCADCGDTEEDSGLTYCHACNKTICVDNCVAAWDDEHGVDFCHGCVESGKVEIVDDDEDGDEY